MKPIFKKSKKETVFIDSSGKIWRANNIQDLIDGYKKLIAFEYIKNHYFDESEDDET